MTIGLMPASRPLSGRCENLEHRNWSFCGAPVHQIPLRHVYKLLRRAGKIEALFAEERAVLEMKSLTPEYSRIISDPN